MFVKYIRPIIVSCTSWKKRIVYTARLIENMLSQTCHPDKIVLNLSTDEFNNMYSDLPFELNDLANKYKNIFEIAWVKENTKAYKKLLPTLQKYHNINGRILTVDEDWEYAADYIDYMMVMSSKYPNNFLTPGIFNNGIHGFAAIYNPQWFMNDNVFNYHTICKFMPCSDIWIEKYLNMAGITYKKVSGIETKIKSLHLQDNLADTYIQKTPSQWMDILTDIH